MTERQLRNESMKILRESLGPVDSVCFIVTVNSPHIQNPANHLQC